ncbi:manganese efflux pump [Hathewaya histolytica]|uniref:manganese efflux pump n=1 Tax=Hathewaya histolytica TaxID=1498 RepID=UPI003B676D36
MSLNYLLLFALALSLDAFGVALGIGINPLVKFKNKVAFTLSFGFFQFFFSFLGAYGGFLFGRYILCFPKVLGGAVVAIVGIMMIKEGMEEKKDNKLILSAKTNIVLGASVSIDAMVLSFTVLNRFKNLRFLLNSTILIGLVAVVMTSIAFLISKKLKEIEIFETYADFISGIILILFGIKMMFL